MSTTILLLAILVLTGSCSSHEVGGLTFELEDKERFCFFEQFHNATVYVFEYKVRSIVPPYVRYMHVIPEGNVRYGRVLVRSIMSCKSSSRRE